MFNINEFVKYDGVDYKIIDFRDENGSIFYDLREVYGDGECNDVPELMLCKDEMSQFVKMVDNFLDELYFMPEFDKDDELYKKLDEMVSRLLDRYCNVK